jgi:hypothetical protein
LGILFRDGIITSTASEQNPDSLLCIDPMKTYFSTGGGKQILVPIGRGFYFGWDPIDDIHTPAHCYYDSPPQYIN